MNRKQRIDKILSNKFDNFFGFSILIPIWELIDISAKAKIIPPVEMS